jgi:hypothetical protein
MYERLAVCNVAILMHDREAAYNDGAPLNTF